MFGDILMLQDIELKAIKRINHNEDPVLFPNLVQNIDNRVVDLLLHNNNERVGWLKCLF